MDVEEKIKLITRKPTEETLTVKELRELLETNDHPVHYIGYEVSGLLHIGSLIVSGFKINDFAKAGVKTQAYFAHYHSLINNKLRGNLEHIIAASKYYEEAFRLFCPKLKTIHATDLYHNNDEYWLNVLRFSKHMTLNRAVRCLPIMGRTEKEKMSLASYFYAPMQAVDIKAMNVDIAHAGMDQRTAHVLARELYPKMGWKKPVAVHHHLLPGLLEPVKMIGKEDSLASKMSKSKPKSAIFIHDSEEEIKKKLREAWCPQKITKGNPVFELAEYVVFHEKESILIERPQKYGGDVELSLEELRKQYEEELIHPLDLKNAVARELNEIIKPLREHFEKHPEFLEVYKKAEITR